MFTVVGRKRAVLSLVLAFVLSLLAACSGGSAKTPVTTPEKSGTGTTPTPAVKKEPIKVRLATSLGLGGSLSALPLFLAKHLGYLEQEGVVVDEITTFAGGAPATQALLGGSMDIVSIATQNVLKVQDQGQDVVIIGLLQDSYTSVLIGSNKFMEKIGHTPKVQELKGAKIGVVDLGGNADVMLRYLLRQAGLDPEKDVTIIPIGPGSQHIAALQKGSVDVTMTAEPAASQAIMQAKVAQAILDPLLGDGPDALRGNVWVSLVAKKSWLDAKPENLEVANRVMRAVARASQFIRDAKNEDAVISYALPQLKGMDEATLRSSLRKQLKEFRADVPREGIEKNNRMMVEGGFIKKAIAYEQVVDVRLTPSWSAPK